MAGQLFRELSEDVAQRMGPVLLYTGHPDTIQYQSTEQLSIKAAPKYDCRGILRRFTSWLHYFFQACFLVARQPKQTLLFITTNPPILGILGLACSFIRKNRYVLLVYDIYPEVVVALGMLRNGLVVRAWRLLTRYILKRAELVITISQDLKRTLENNYSLHSAPAGNLIVIPNWADTDIIRPMKKECNWFARLNHQVGKTTVLYSGNIGYSHDIEIILSTARLLRNEQRIHFLFIGEGGKDFLVEKAIADEKLKNITLLHLQNEEILPFSMTAGDIGVVPYLQGTEGCTTPSKFYYYLAAGVVPLVVSSRINALTTIIGEYQCGIAVNSGDSEGMAKAIFDLDTDPALLLQYKKAARATAEKLFSRRNTGSFIDILNTCCHGRAYDK